MASWDGLFKAVQVSMKDKGKYGEFEIKREDLGNLKKLEFDVSFDSGKSTLKVRIRKDGGLYGFNHVMKGPIDCSNLKGGLKVNDRHALLRVEKIGTFDL